MLSNKAPYPPNDGSSIAIYNMAKGIIENNNDLHLLTINTKKHYKADAAVPDEFKLKSHYHSVFHNANTSIVGALINLFFSSESYFVSRFYFTEFRNKLIQTLQANQFDIVQLEGIFMAVYLNDIRKYSKAKIAIRTHNVEHVIWNRVIANEKNILKKWYLGIQNNRLKKFELSKLPMADALVPITENDEQIFRKCGIKIPSKVCLTGILKEKRVKSINPKFENTVFHLGSMDWMPNVEGVLWFLKNVWPLVMQKSAGKAKCVIAGRNMPENIHALKNENLEVLGAIENAEEMYSNYSIQIVPLLSGSGMRIKILDGLRFGKPIVSTSVGAEGIPMNSGKNILITDDPETFANYILELMNNKTLYNKIADGAFSFAESEMDNTQLVNQLMQFYQNL